VKFEIDFKLLEQGIKILSELGESSFSMITIFGDNLL